MSDQLPDCTAREFFLWVLRFRRRFRVTGRSMMPLLNPGDEVLVDIRAYRRTPPLIGDIVVAWHPFQANLRLVKRVTSVLADGRCLLRGDNPAESTDSRSFGDVALQNIVGRVTSRFG